MAINISNGIVRNDINSFVFKEVLVDKGKVVEVIVIEDFLDFNIPLLDKVINLKVLKKDGI